MGTVSVYKDLFKKMYIRVGKMTQQFRVYSSFQRGPCFGSNTYWVLLTAPPVPGALSSPCGLVDVVHILGNFFFWSFKAGFLCV